MSKTLQGKCWIYKRATLYVPNQKPKIIDYSTGIDSFACNTVEASPEGLHYNWEIVPGQIIPIPLNISRHNTYSIIRQGELTLEDGSTISWEFIFGKFQTHGQVIAKEFVEYLPFLLVILVLILFMMRK